MKRILIVEDDIAYTKLLRDELEAQGFQVINATNGVDGLEMAIRDQPDLILLDVRMPKMDGMTMLSALRKDAYGATAKVIILTNYEADNDIIRNVIKDEPLYYCIKSDLSLEGLLNKILETIGSPYAGKP